MTKLPTNLPHREGTGAVPIQRCGSGTRDCIGLQCTRVTAWTSLRETPLEVPLLSLRPAVVDELKMGSHAFVFGTSRGGLWNEPILNDVGWRMSEVNV